MYFFLCPQTGQNYSLPSALPVASQLQLVTDGSKHLTTTSTRNALSVQLAIRNLKGNLSMPKVVVLTASHTLGKENNGQSKQKQRKSKLSQMSSVLMSCPTLVCQLRVYFSLNRMRVYSISKSNCQSDPKYCLCCFCFCSLPFSLLPTNSPHLMHHQ